MEAVSLPQSPVKSFKWVTYLRVTVILILSFYIVVAGQILPISKLIQYPGFYVAVVFSFLLILLIVYIVKWFNKKLDQKYPWRAMPLKRLIYQVIICYLSILTLIYVAVRIYFWLLKADFHASGYMNLEFQLVNWMLLALNFKLIIIEMWPAYFQKDNRDKKQYLSEMECNISTKKIFLPIAEIACFKREGNVGSVWSKQNEKYHINLNMEQLNERLDPHLFIQISRSEMFAYSYIKGYDSKAAKIDFKTSLDPEVTGKISEGRLKNFILSYEEYRRLSAKNTDILS